MAVSVKSKEAVALVGEILVDFTGRIDANIAQCDQAAAKNPKEAPFIQAKVKGLLTAKQILQNTVSEKTGGNGQ